MRTEADVMESMKKHFGAVADPRVLGRITYPLMEILVMAFIGVLCGGDDWERIAMIVHEHRNWFQRVAHREPAVAYCLVAAGLEIRLVGKQLFGFLQCSVAPLGKQQVEERIGRESLLVPEVLARLRFLVKYVAGIKVPVDQTGRSSFKCVRRGK